MNNRKNKNYLKECLDLSSITFHEERGFSSIMKDLKKNRIKPLKVTCVLEGTFYY